MGVQGEGLTGLGSVNFAVPAGCETAIAVPVKLKAEKPGKASAKFMINGRLWDMPLNVEPQAKVLRNGDQAQVGPATMKIDCDGNTLKISFEVNDASASGYSAGRDPWEQDCIELFIDAEPLANPVKYPESYTDKVARLFIMPYAPEGQRLAVKPGALDLSGVKATSSTKKGGYIAEVEIPLAALGGKVIGFEAQIDDADTVKRNSSSTWNGKGDAFKNRFSFGFIEFKSVASHRNATRPANAGPRD